ncbi:AMP-dependent synthetase/ligase [Pseudonocardia acaciae]|uniref:AMP-dependent synthetase/ligase n=1 Tax=Pseudonocardia acaciae TaxID=551276 RepID=UPI00048AC45C|nr:long-chain fatty acid--CoA ligase [Pseudonocardia acaciae]
MTEPAATDRGTILDLVDHNATEHPDRAAIVDGQTRLTWSQYRRRARAVALALLDLGVRPGEVVGLHMVNRAEHPLADIGALYAGAIPTSFYNTLAADQLAYVADDCGATVAIVDADKLELWRTIRDRLPRLRHLVAVDLDPAEPAPEGVRRFEDLVAAAEERLDARGDEVDKASALVRPDNTLTIVYTSGTTGNPKGTVITHVGIRFVLEGVDAQRTDDTGPPPEGWSAVSYLPLAHLAERTFSHYMACHQAITVTYVRDPRRVAEALPTVRPHIFFGVPRIWEKIHGAIRERAATAPSPVRRALAGAAFSVARRVGQARFDRRTPDLAARLLHPLFDRLVYSRIRAAIGMDRVEIAASGAAPLSVEVMAFFEGIGITILEAYGMTESSVALTVTPPDAPRPGTVGKPLPGVELRLAEDCEILARGPNITPGYLNRPEATAEAIDADGWLHTGDLGTLDADGYLTITGRKKELIINAAGKNIAPGTVELAVTGESGLVGPVCVYGDAKPYLVALLTLDPIDWQAWCAARGISVATVAEAVADDRIQAEVARAVEAANARLSRVEQIKRWTLLDHLWDTGTGELTPTLKLKRPVINERYREQIEGLYAAPG